MAGVTVARAPSQSNSPRLRMKLRAPRCNASVESPQRGTSRCTGADASAIEHALSIRRTPRRSSSARCSRGSRPTANVRMACARSPVPTITIASSEHCRICRNPIRRLVRSTASRSSSFGSFRRQSSSTPAPCQRRPVAQPKDSPRHTLRRRPDPRRHARFRPLSLPREQAIREITGAGRR